MYQQPSPSPSTKLQAAAWARKARQGLQMLGLWLMLLCGAPSALAQTPVTGVITSNTSLRAAQSPYLFQGDVIVDNNATLSVEPGVTIQMAAAASFTLKRGALQAVGTPSLPIKITSASATPAAGDWRQWRFTAGTNQALTQLGHVVIEYGSGVAIESASPVINNTAINHHSGPAISMDLASSPVGTGNTANGNSLNAISVPSGAIQSQVIWGLVGIPYLVEQGLVHVGKAPMPVQLLSASGKSVAVGKGMLTPSGEYYPTSEVYLRRAASELGGDNQAITVHLRCLNSDKCRPVPQTITVLADQEIANFQIEGFDIGSTQLEARVDGYEQPSLVSVDVVAPIVHVQGLEGYRAIGDARDEFQIKLEVPGTFYLSGVYPAKDTFVNLSVVEQMPGVVIDGLYDYWGGAVDKITVGSYDGATATIAQYLYVGVPAAGGNYRVKADVSGIGSGTSEIQWVRYADGLQIQSFYMGSKNIALIGKGLYSTDLALAFVEAGDQVSFDHEVTVKLRCVDEAICKTPEIVKIPAGDLNAFVQVKGIGVGESQIEVLAEGFSVAPTPVKVVPPTVYFEQLDGVRILNGGNDDFSLTLSAVDRELVNSSQMPFEDIIVDVSVIDKNPGNIVRGIFGYPIGDPILQETICKDTSGTGVFIDNPIALGSYRVSASIDGGDVVVSEEQFVVSPSSFKNVDKAGSVNKGMALGKDMVAIKSGGCFDDAAKKTKSTPNEVVPNSASLKPAASGVITVNP